MTNHLSVGRVPAPLGLCFDFRISVVPTFKELGVAYRESAEAQMLGQLPAADLEKINSSRVPQAAKEKADNV